MFWHDTPSDRRVARRGDLDRQRDRTFVHRIPRDSVPLCLAIQNVSELKRETDSRKPD